MGKVDRQKMARAAEHVARRSNIVVTEVIEKDEDKSLTLTDRFAAMFAAIVVCGASYFATWFLLEIKVGAGAGYIEPAAWLWIWTWRLPFLATAVTGFTAFFRPGWTYRYFGKITEAIGRVL